MFGSNGVVVNIVIITMEDVIASRQTNTIHLGSTELCNDTVTECKGCCRSFGFIVRKSMCRLCEDIYCGKCTNYRIWLPNYAEKQRVCEACKDNVLINGHSLPGLQPAPEALPHNPVCAVPDISKTVIAQEQIERSELEHKSKTNITNCDKAAMSLSACNVLRAAQEAESRQHFGDFLSSMPVKVGVYMSPPDTLPHSECVEHPITSITPPIVRRLSPPPTLSPDRCRQNKQQQPTAQRIQKQQLAEAETSKKTTERSAVEDSSTSSLCNAPESPLLPLRRVYRDPVSGKYLEEKDLKLHDESLVDDLEPYVVYDSDLDRTFEQGGSLCESSVSSERHYGLDDFHCPGPHSPVPMRSTSIPLKGISRTERRERGVVSSGDFTELDGPHVSSKLTHTADVENTTYEEQGHSASDGDGPEVSSLHYHVIITADELMTEESSRGERQWMMEREVTEDEAVTRGAAVVVMPTKNKSRVSETSGLSWRALAQVHHSASPSKRPSLRLVLLSMALIIIFKVVTLPNNMYPFPYYKHLDIISSDSPTVSSSNPPDVLNTQEGNNGHWQFATDPVEGDGAFEVDSTSGSDVLGWLTEPRVVASSLKLHIGVDGFRSQCYVSSMSGEDVNSVAMPRYPQFDGELTSKSSGWRPSITAELIQMKTEALSRVMKRVLHIPKFLSHIIVNVIRYVVGRKGYEMD